MLAVEVYKCVSNSNPTYLSELFNMKKISYELRDNKILERPNVKHTEYGLKSFRSYGAKIWNNLPTSIKSGLTVHEFKNLIKSWSGPKCNCSVCGLFT